MDIVTKSFQETIALGERFVSSLKEKDVVILTGTLGAGKTTFVQGILKGFAIKARALSPTFTLMREYHTKRLDIYHVDLYRITAGDVTGIGLEDYMYAPKSVTLIEWGQKIVDTLPCYIEIRFTFLDENSRKVHISQKGMERRKIIAG